MVTSSLQKIGGVPTLTVNGKPVGGAAYVTYYNRLARYEDFAAAGCKLFSVTVYFAEKTINEVSQIPPFKVGIFDKEEPDFALADAEVEQILAACPDAMIFPRVNMSLPTRWEVANPDELCDTRTPASSQNRPCFSSRKWLEETKRLMGLYIDHVEQSSYRDHFIGYQIADGNTEEWFGFDQVGSQGKRSRERYAEYLAATGEKESEEGYHQFLSDVVAEDICDIAHYVKEKTQNRLVVGAFYGYSMNCISWTACHSALGKVLRCPDVDFLCSPVCYSYRRAPKRDLPCMLPVDSLRLHGKLYFVENDIRTHLSKAPNDLPHYNQPIWFGPEKAVSKEVIKMAAARALVHGYAEWWFDMWGGWYADEEYLALMKRHFAIVSETGKNRLPASEIAVFTDERSYVYAGKSAYDIIPPSREVLGKIGAPYDTYLADDAPAAAGNYKLAVFLAPVMSETIEKGIAAAKASGAKVFVWTPETHPTAEDFRAMCAEAGVKLYTDRPAVVYACGGYLFLHTVADGEITLTDNGKQTFTDLFTGEKLTFPCVLEAGKSYLFERD